MVSKHRGTRRRALVTLLGLFTLLLAAAWYILIAEKFGPVAGTGVWRSAQLDADSLEGKIHDQGLRAVINLRGPNPGQPWYDAERARLATLGVPLHDIPLSAWRLPEHTRLRELVTALDTLPKPLLVHCQHGNDRSGLAAILARLLAGDDLEAAETEISPWRGVLRRDTVGRLFLSQYRGWLKERGVAHSPIRLRAFIADGYVDADGNLRFVVELVNGQRLDPRGASRLTVKAAEGLRIEGWAFDPGSHTQPAAISFRLGDHELGNARLGLLRPDVATAFGDTDLGATGWRLESPVMSGAGCGPLLIEMRTREGRSWRSPSLGEICLEE